MTDPFDGPGCEVPGCTRPQAPGWRICASDGRHVGELLAKLGDRYAALTAAPSMAAPTPGTGHGGTLASQRDPARLHVLAVTDWRSGANERLPADPWGWDDTVSVFDVLARHADTVRCARELTLPQRQIVIRLRPERHAGPLCPTMARAFRQSATPCRHPSCRAQVVLHTVWADLTVQTERKVLADNLDWILGQDWAAEFHADITSLWTLLCGGARTVGVCGACGGPVMYANRQASCACGTGSGLDLIKYATGRTA